MRGPTTIVATANVEWHLPDVSAREALALVLAHEPDLVALQEWGLSRRRLLRGSAPAYAWVAPLVGGCPVGFRSDRYERVRSRQHLLSRPRRADPDPGGRRRWLRPRIATLVVVRDTRTGEEVCLVDVHLTPGVQSGGRYRADRPVVVARHRHEVRRLARLVADQQARGRTVLVAGDLNFDGLRLPGLTSAWEGREDQPGTLGDRRKVDDVQGPRRADRVTLVTTASDHRAVVVTRDHGPVSAASRESGID